MGKANRKKKPVTLRAAKQESPQVLIGFDGHPPMFRAARDLENKGQRIKVDGPQNINVDRLEWYLAHRLIEKYQHEAGRRLQLARETEELSGGSNYQGAGGGSPSSTLPDVKCDAMHNVNKVKKALPPRMFRMLELVVIEGKTAEKAAALMQWNTRAAIPCLTLCLDALAMHYGMC